MSNNDYLVDVPVRVAIWTRPECQQKQFEIIKKAKPSILFLQSDGGRNEEEWNAIIKNRKMYDEGVDWNCQVFKIYENENLGMYAMSKKVQEYIWERVDRCIFLEDDYIPSVSFFAFCAELLERYKDDLRISMISGNNVFEIHESAKQYDYFFTEEGWSIWGTATWRNRAQNRQYPLKYSNNDYVKNCLKDNMPAFWYDKVDRYCRGILADGHYPGTEFHYAVNNYLHHQLSIVPTKNMICNIGKDGEHAKSNKMRKGKDDVFFNIPAYEVTFPIKHPDYVINDRAFGVAYSKLLGHSRTILGLYLVKIRHGLDLLFKGKLISTLLRKRNNKISEK